MSETDAALDDLARVRVADVVLGTASSLISIAYLRLGFVQGHEAAADLGEARHAIDALAAIRGSVAATAGAEAEAEVAAAVAQLQLTYAQLAQAAGGETAPAEPTVETPPRPPIWTPGGEV